MKYEDLKVGQPYRLRGFGNTSVLVLLTEAGYRKAIPRFDHVPYPMFMPDNTGSGGNIAVIIDSSHLDRHGLPTTLELVKKDHPVLLLNTMVNQREQIGLYYCIFEPFEGDFEKILGPIEDPSEQSVPLHLAQPFADVDEATFRLVSALISLIGQTGHDKVAKMLGLNFAKMTPDQQAILLQAMAKLESTLRDAAGLTLGFLD